MAFCGFVEDCYVVVFEGKIVGGCAFDGDGEMKLGTSCTPGCGLGSGDVRESSLIVAESFGGEFDSFSMPEGWDLNPRTGEY